MHMVLKYVFWGYGFLNKTIPFDSLSVSDASWATKPVLSEINKERHN